MADPAKEPLTGDLYISNAIKGRIRIILRSRARNIPSYALSFWPGEFDWDEHKIQKYVGKQPHIDCVEVVILDAMQHPPLIRIECISTLKDSNKVVFKNDKVHKL